MSGETRTTLERVAARFLRHKDRNLGELLRGTIVSGAMQVVEVAVKFGFNVLLGRLLGASGTGLYYLAFTVTALGSVIGRFGLDRTLIRYIAATMESQNYVAAKGAAIKGIAITLMLSSATALVIFLLAPWLASSVFGENDLIVPLRIMAVAVLPLAMLTVVASMLRGLRKVFFSQLILSVMWPALGAIGIAILGASAGVRGATWAQLSAMIITAALGLLLFWRAAPELHGVRGTFSTKRLFDNGLTMFTITMMNTLLQWSPNLILGCFVPASEVGVFALASRTAALVSFAVTAVNWMAAPLVAAHHERDDFQALEATVRHAVVLMTALGVPLTVILFTVPDWVMSIFGEQFRHGDSILEILTLGYLVSILCGPVGIVLTMTGHEKIQRNISLAALGASCGLGVILSPLYGAQGMAVSVMSGMAIQNILGVVCVYRQLGILSLPIALSKDNR